MKIIGGISYATQSGLGHLLKAFHDNGVINRVFINRHPRYEQHLEWYTPDVRFNTSTQEQFLDGLDVLVLFENAFTAWPVVSLAKKRGIKVVLIPMYEWTPNPLPIKPDLVICPSDLDLEYFTEYQCTRINIPVDVPWKLRTRAIQFVHNAGHGQVGYAKGTPEVIKAMKYVTSPVTLLVRGQPGEQRITDLFRENASNSKVRFEYGNLPYEELFAHGDVYINAERYNGLSLPLQEAYAAGMLVMTTNRFPANTWLPREPMFDAESFESHRVNHTTFQRANVRPVDIAKKIDAFYDTDITRYSLYGKEWATSNSWEKLKPVWLETLESI